MREHARSFAFAARFLPSAIRPDVSDLYAFCRTVDDLVDEPASGWTSTQVRRQLEDWQRWLNSSPIAPNGSSATAGLARVMAKYAISPIHLIDLVEGCKSDLDQPRFEDFQQLERYCYQVGSTVGLAMSPILGVTDPRGLACARDLGIAMQLTNVIRDVREDVAMGRYYLPAVEVRAFGCPVEAPERGGDLSGLIRLQCERARGYYRSGLAGIKWVQPGARFGIQLAAALYEAILDKIAQEGYDVYTRRASTTLRQKVWLAFCLRLASFRG